MSFSQPLLRGLGRGGSYGLVDAASTAVESARFRYERAADLVVARVEHAFWQLRQAESNESALRQSTETSRAIYDRNVALQARDVATALDVLTAERRLATRETQLWEAQRQRVDAAERLLFLVYGENARNDLIMRAPSAHTPSDSAVVPDIPALAAAEAIATAQRSDATAATRDVDAGRRRAQQAKSQRLPRLDLIAGYGYGGTAPTTRFLNFGDSSNVRSSTWTLGLSASLFQRNDAAAAVDRLLAALGSECLTISDSIGTEALTAAQTYGRCVGHPAALNFGDCFAYACAKYQRMSLLYKGDDFAKTDLA